MYEYSRVPGQPKNYPGVPVSFTAFKQERERMEIYLSNPDLEAKKLEKYRDPKAKPTQQGFSLTLYRREHDKPAGHPGVRVSGFASEEEIEKMDIYYSNSRMEEDLAKKYYDQQRDSNGN